jgi:hypothetical protein
MTFYICPLGIVKRILFWSSYLKLSTILTSVFLFHHCTVFLNVSRRRQPLFYNTRTLHAAPNRRLTGLANSIRSTFGKKKDCYSSAGD